MRYRVESTTRYRVIGWGRKHGRPRWSTSAVCLDLNATSIADALQQASETHTWDGSTGPIAFPLPCKKGQPNHV